MPALEDYSAEDLEDGQDLTPGEVRQIAFDLRLAPDAPIHDLTDKERLAVALEALARVMGELATAIDTAAQFRKEFEAFKGEVRTRYLPRT